MASEKYVKRGKKREHVLVAEKALGKELPKGAEVHHFNEDKKDNRPSNLVICPDRAYHMMLHYRQRALDACGNANWMKCEYCKKFSPPESMAIRGGGVLIPKARHNECHAKYEAERKLRNGSAYQS